MLTALILYLNLDLNLVELNRIECKISKLHEIIKTDKKPTNFSSHKCGQNTNWTALPKFTKPSRNLENRCDKTMLWNHPCGHTNIGIFNQVVLYLRICETNSTALH